MAKFGEEFYKKMAMLSRDFLDLQQLRVSTEARIRKIKKEEEGHEDVLNVLKAHHSRLKIDEKEMLKNIEELLKDHPIRTYCENVKGLGPIAAMTFLGYIDPFVATTAGKAKSYLGFIPGKALKKGQKVRMNLEAKGRFWIIGRNVIMAKDPFYTELYHKKKDYYLNKSREVREDGRLVVYPPFKTIIENPELCPDYEECKKRLEGRAKRMGREVKQPPCKAHCDNMAKRWLIGIIISHATQIMRETEELDVSSFKAHQEYVAPLSIEGCELSTEENYQG